jgi:hypothetical protein
MLLFLRVTPNRFGVNHAEQRAVDARIPAPLLGLDLAANTAITIARRSRQAGFGEPDWTAADNQNRNLDDITVCLVGAQ